MSVSWTIVWGWAASGSTLWRESFTDKRRCWGRVRALMNVLDEAEAAESFKGPPRVPTLQVWMGTEATTFRRYALGSRFARWGRWGSFTMGSADAG